MALVVKVVEMNPISAYENHVGPKLLKLTNKIFS